jgi:hypothetical protein
MKKYLTRFAGGCKLKSENRRPRTAFFQNEFLPGLWYKGVIRFQE